MKVAVVTGGASGIGLASCARLRADGFTLAVCDLDAAGAISAAGPSGFGAAVDVADADVVAGGRSAYTTSKGAALMLAKSIAVDYAGFGIRSNAVCPGMAETAMTQWRLDVPELRAAIESRIPLGRVAQPDDIADAVALLASDRLAYLTGSALVVDGGYTAL